MPRANKARPCSCVGSRYIGVVSGIGFSSDAQHDLARWVVAKAALESLAGFGQRKDLVDGGPELAAVCQPGQLHQLGAVGHNDEVDGGDAARGGALLRAGWRRTPTGRPVG